MSVRLFADASPYEIRWHGRGGQGAITAAKTLAQAAHLNGYQGATASPSFGAERRGAPVSASTRISPRPIMVVSQIEAPDMVVVLDHTLLRDREVVSGLRTGGWLVVNSWQTPEQLDVEGDFNIATADATGISRELGLIVSGLIVVNTAMLGADGYWGTVLVAAGDHQHLIAFGVVVAGKDVCRQVGTGYVPQVQGTISVRPGYTDKDSLHQGLTIADILSQSAIALKL